VQVWRGAAAVAAVAATCISISRLDFLLGLWIYLLDIVALVGYLFATKILLPVKVKVLGGGLCAYGWVTILLYCLWLNEHT
jgi:hypothetical protein